MAGGSKPHGGHKANESAKRHRALYVTGQRREKNKLKRILKSSGLKAARKYALRHGLVLK